MTPYPADPVRAVGPMRVVVTTYPSREAALDAVEAALGAHLAACANVVPITSRYWWRGKRETAEEALVLFKTVPKRVGALFRLLEDGHPYEAPEIAEVDVPRVGGKYLRYLIETLEPGAVPVPQWPLPRRRGAPRARGARYPGRTRAPHRPRSR